MKHFFPRCLMIINFVFKTIVNINAILNFSFHCRFLKKTVFKKLFKTGAVLFAKRLNVQNRSARTPPW